MVPDSLNHCLENLHGQRQMLGGGGGVVSLFVVVQEVAILAIVFLVTFKC